jgi:putative membrane protein
MCRIGIVILMVAPLIIPTGSGAAKQESTGGPPSFLGQAAAKQQSEIDLGQLAMQRAGNEQVKQFGARMVQDHQKAQLEIRQLVSKQGLSLHIPPSEQHQHEMTQLSKLSGKEFDRAYVGAMLRNHASDIKEFEDHSMMERDQQVRQWAASTLPVLKEHRDKVKTIASSLGVNAATAQ